MSNQAWSVAALRSVILPLFLVVSASGCAREAEPDFESDVANIASEVLEKPLLNAVSIGVVYKGESVIRHAGELEKGKGNTPDDHTLYEIGSVSKVIVGTMLAKAVLEGKVGLDDPVAQYLNGDFPGLSSEGEPVRVRHILTHSANLPNLLPRAAEVALQDFTKHEVPAKLNAAYEGYRVPEFMRDLHDVNIASKPGEYYAYSSVGSELTAHIIETVYRMPFEQLMIEFLTDAAAMQDTKIQLGESETARLATGYHSDNPVPTTPMPQLTWGASGNVKATLPDMIRFIKYQLEENDVVKESHRPLAVFERNFGLGYFWNISDPENPRASHYFHHGGVPRSQCYIYLVPNMDLGIFIITNQSGNDTADTLEWAIDEIISGVEARGSADH